MTLLFPERMTEVSIIVHKKYFEELLTELHESGFLQIFDITESKILKSNGIAASEMEIKRIEMLSDLILKITRLREILRKSEVEPSNIYEALKSYKPPVKADIIKRSVGEIIKDARGAISELDYIFDLDTERTRILTDLNHLKLQFESLKILQRLKVDIKMLNSTPNLLIKIGYTEQPNELKKELHQSLSPEVQQNDQYALFFHSAFHSAPEGQEGFNAIIITPKSEDMNIRKVVVGRYFKELDISGYEGTPDFVLRRLNDRISKLKNLLKQLDEKIGIFYDQHHHRLTILNEELEIIRSKAQVQSKFAETVKTKAMCGWCLSRNINALKDLCQDVTDGNIELFIRDASSNPDKNVPISLRNPRWVKPFEMLTKTFAVPKYNEIDPTMIIAPLFVIFFGIMLGDAGYGLIILILSVYGYIQFGEASKIIKDLSYLGIFLGISTIVIGLLMGTFFGDLIPRFIYTDPDALLYSIQLGGYSLPYNSFKSPMLLFIISLIIGIFIINLGLFLGALQNALNGSYKKLLTTQIAWFIIQPPAAILLGQYLVGLWILSENIIILSSLILLIGIILLIINYRAQTLFEIFGYLGDWMSFARLLALSLATMGMAFTINLIGELIISASTNSITLIIISIITIILLALAHFANFILQTLGAAIHSLRLQYIEFFNRCYEGGGNSFKPFHSHRNYTRYRK